MTPDTVALVAIVIVPMIAAYMLGVRAGREAGAAEVSERWVHSLQNEVSRLESSVDYFRDKLREQ